MKIGCLLLFVAALPFGPAATAPRDPVATLTGVQGNVEIRPHGTGAWTRVQSTRPLAEGTAVRLSGSGRALIYQPGCPPLALKAGDARIISAGKRWLTGTTSQRITAAQHRSLLQLLARSARSYRSAPTGVRPGVRDMEIARSPRGELVLDGRPTLIWRHGSEGSRYELELYRGETVVWDARTSKPLLPYPAGRPALRPGRYQWQVYVTAPSGRQDADGAAFTVPDAATARKIRAALEAARSLAAGDALNLPLVSLYVSYELYTPAEAALRQALTRSPRDSEARHLLAHVYSLMGRMGARERLLREAR